MIGLGEIVIIGGVIVLIFGASRIPKLGKSLGESVKEFKKGMRGEEKTENGEAEDEKGGEQDKNGD